MAAMTPSPSETTTGQCPVARNGSTSGSRWNPMLWIGSTSATGSRSAPSNPDTAPQQSEASGCPVKGGLPPSLEESAQHAQKPYHDQRIPLSTQRAISSIPRADELREKEKNDEKHAPHQPAEGDRWVYPSEQQFYNAMRRKGWEADESTIPAVVRIHNAVNERGWSQVRKWERELHNNPNPRLVRFLGRPQDQSPKAWFNTNILFYNPPFDRHDWYVDAGDGKARRYVIDFYNGSEEKTSQGQGIPHRPPSLFLDVRPALDTPEAFKDRAHMFFRDAFPGLFSAFGGNQSSASTTPATNATSSVVNEANMEPKSG